MRTFILIKRYLGNATKVSFEWWEYDIKDKNLYNQNGGWTALLSTDVILETVKAKNWDVLLTPVNVAKTSEYHTLFANSTNKSIKTGWLAPDGAMHHCKYADHISYVHMILNTTVPEIERLGWLHIFSDMKTLNVTKRITQQQAITAREELGLTVFDEDILSY